MMQLNVRRTFLGDYDWGFLCMPRLPWRRSNGLPPFLGKDDKVSILIAIVMGLQHSLAMVGGIITVPLMLTDPAEGNFSLSERNYLISAALIVSGLVSFVQVYQAKIPRTKYVLGSGLLSVMGVSVTFLPIAQQSMSMLRSCFCNGVPCIVGQTCKDCPVEATGHCRSAQDAYGEILGTVLVGCWLEVILSFCPPRVLRRIFPPVVTGVVVVLIGTSLVAVGFKYWGGGVDCADNVLTMKSECRGNGNSNLAFGSWEYIGLGLCVFGTLLLIELFGSPFMRNTQVFLGLLIGMIVASSVHVYRCVEECAPKCRRDCYSVLPPGVVYNSATQGLEGLPRNSTTFPSLICQNTCGEPQCNISCESRRYVTSQGIVTANWFTFLWVKRFKLGFYPPALIPISFAFIITMMECIGDITATTEASGLETTGSVYEESLQGGILADGLSSFFSALATTLPVTTFAQNNGVITFTRCASRRAGYACAISLIILGTISKFAATLLAIPNCVLGGMTTFLFMNVVTSGFNVLASEGINRRNRFIIAMSLGIGLGVTLVPEWANIANQPQLYPREGPLWPVRSHWSAAYRGFRDALIIILSNGFSCGGFTAVILNLVLPQDNEEIEPSVAPGTVFLRQMVQTRDLSLRQISTSRVATQVEPGDGERSTPSERNRRWSSQRLSTEIQVLETQIPVAPIAAASS